jgi:hypothetical protein
MIGGQNRSLSRCRSMTIYLSVPRQRCDYGRVGLSGRTLEKHRTYGTGPKYRKIGGRVVYALDDLKAWADLGAKTSTSDPGVATVYPAKRSAAPSQLATQSHRR